MDLNKLKKANKIYQELADKTIDEAMYELNTYDELDHEVLSLVKSLITNSAESNTYFDQKISKHYQKNLHHQWQIGDQLGGYELLQLIGQGGMSTVYKAHRIDSETQKPVAIKIFNLTNQNPEIKGKFLAEQQILARLTHPNIIDFHHGENTDQGNSYLVMELISGSVAIDQYVNKYHLNDQAIIELIVQAAEALQYAHSHLIIHRDVKPSNLLINNNGQLKVLDFGIAKLINPDADTLKAKKEDTLLALTPSFAAPEQINAQSISTSTDVFSLAAVAVSLLTQMQPFPANRLLQAGREDEMHVRQLIQQQIKDRDLRNVLIQALKPNPQDRYPNMFAFRSDLKFWLAQKPVTATSDSWWYRLRCFAARRTALFTTSVLLGSTVLAAVAGLTYQNQAIKDEANKAQAVKNFMLNAFSVTDPNYSQGVDLSSKDLLRSAADKIALNDDMDDEIEFELLTALALANGRLGYYPEAIDLLNEALNLKPKNEQATALLANYLFTAGEIESVNTLLDKTQENQFKSIPQTAALKRVRANVLAQAGQHEAALREFSILEPLSKTPSEIIAKQSLLAEIFYLNGDSAQSIEILQQLKKDYPLPATDVLNLGLNSDLVQYHDRVGNFSEAMALTQENIKAFKEILGDEHPDLGLAYNSLSVFQRLDGQLDEAIESAKISEKIYRKRYGDSSEGLAQALGNIGVAEYYKKQHEPAIDNLTQAADMLTVIFGADHPETMNALYNLATILSATDNAGKALPILERMYAIEVKNYGKENRNTMYTQRSMALALAHAGQFDLALEHAKENLYLLKQHFSNEPNFIRNIYSVMGRIHYLAGNYPQAIEQSKLYINDWDEGNENLYAKALNLIAKSHLALNANDEALKYYQKWTNHLKKIYGEADIKHLEALLEFAEKAQSINENTQTKSIISSVLNIIDSNNLNHQHIQDKLNELSH